MEDAEVPKYSRIEKGRAPASDAGGFDDAGQEDTENTKSNVYSIEEARIKKELRDVYKSEGGEQERFRAQFTEERESLKKEIEEIEKTMSEYSRAPLWERAWHRLFDRSQLQDEWNRKVKRLRALEK